MNKKSYLKLSLLFLVITILPYLIGYIFTPNGFKFSGLVNASLDHLSYLAKTNNGHYFDTLNWVFRSNHTTNINGGYIFTLYSLFGFIFGNIGISGIGIFHILKLSSNILFLYALYKFLQEFIKKENHIFTATCILFAGSIAQLLPYLQILTGSVITDLTPIPKDIFPITMGLYTPHFTVATALLLLSFICAKKYNENKIKYSIYNGIILLLISTIHPQVAVFIGLVQGIYILTEIKNRSYKIKDLLPVSLWGLIPIPYLIYMLNLTKNNILVSTWIENNVHPASTISIITYFIPAVCILLYLIIKKKEMIKENKLIFFWGLLNFIYILIPGKYQVKLTEGLSIPIIIFISLLIQNSGYKTLLKQITTCCIIICCIPMCLDGILPNRADSLAYYPEYYEELYEDIDKEDFPKIIFSNLYTSGFMLGNTKQIFPVSNHDECEKFTEYYNLYMNAVETKDFSFLEKLNNVDYYIYDKYISEQMNTTEHESNLPYKKVRETENYIIYDLTEKEPQ